MIELLLYIMDANIQRLKKFNEKRSSLMVRTLES